MMAKDEERVRAVGPRRGSKEMSKSMRVIRRIGGRQREGKAKMLDGSAEIGARQDDRSSLQLRVPGKKKCR